METFGLSIGFVGEVGRAGTLAGGSEEKVGVADANAVELYWVAVVGVYDEYEGLNEDTGGSNAEVVEGEAGVS